jgi:uncharacterized protein (TIGR02231 family)
MKKSLLVLCLFFSFLVSKAQNIENIIESSPSEVTVFLSGAELKHKNDLKLIAGQNTFRFIGLPSSINPSSISFNLDESVKIISISGEINYQGKLKTSKARLILEDSVTYFEDELTKLNNELEAWQSEKNLLQANQSRIGNNNGVSVLELQAFANHYRTRIREVNDKLFEQNKKIAAQKHKSLGVVKALEQIKTKEAIPAFELNLIVAAKEAKTISAKWSYVINDAGWATTYDMRAKGIDKPIQFTYKGNVYNNSSIDWKQVKLKLSTSDVMQNATPPYITSWKLNFETNESYGNSNMQQQSYYQNQTINNMDFEAASGDANISRAASVPMSDVAVSELSTEFEIKELYTIPSDNRAYAVEINEYELKADYNYVCTPKMDKDAFLMAKILGWESLNLIEGEANIYYNDSYVGKTYINLRRANDTLEISLGRDKKVIVNRIKKQEFSSKKFLSSTLTETFSYELNVRNTNSTPITLELKDQIPVSGSSEIEVEVLDVSGATVNKDSGLLSWNMNLGAGESKTYKLSYAIKCPKNKKINIQKLKMQRQYKK